MKSATQPAAAAAQPAAEVTQEVTKEVAKEVAKEDACFEELYARSHAARLGLTRAEFSRCLARVCARHLPADASPVAREQFLRGLQLEELALACACVCGHEPAWNDFFGRYRALLYQAAAAIAGDEAAGGELAAALIAQLYGVRDEGARVPGNSKFSHYSGRGSLAGWLRAVLARAFIDDRRSRRRLTSLEEEQEAGAQFAAPPANAEPVADPRLAQATDAVLAALDAESRYLLAAYFLDGRTLAAIARTLATHESTVSRKLARITAEIRRQILRQLKAAGMSARAAEEALNIDIRDLEVDVRARLQAQARKEPR